MRNRLIACFLSLTLFFNSFAPCMAFAVGEGEQALDDSESEVTTSEIEQEARDTALQLGREYKENHPEEVAKALEEESSSVPAVAYTVADPYGVATADNIFETVEEILYLTRKYVIEIKDTVHGLFSSMTSIITAVVSYHDPDGADYSYGSMAYFVKWGYFVDLNMAADIETTMGDVADLLDSVGGSLGDDLSDAVWYLEHYLGYNPAGDDDDHVYKAAELLLYITNNTEFKDEDGNIYSLASMFHDFMEEFSLSNEENSTVFGLIASRLTYPVGNANYTAGYSLYQILQHIKSVDSHLSVLDDIYSELEDFKDTYQNSFLVEFFIVFNVLNERLQLVVDRLTYTTSGGDTYSASALLYNIWSRLNWPVDGVNYTAGYSLYHIMQNTFQLDYLDDVYARLSWSQDGTSFTVGYTMYQAWQRLKSIDGDLDKLDSISLIASRLTYPVGDANYTAGYSLYKILETITDVKARLNWNVDGTNYTVGYTMYQAWQRLKSIDSDLDVLDDISESLDLLVYNSFKQQLFDATDAFTSIFGALEFALIASSIDELTDTLETTFPFSLVAGFVAIIGLLQADPVAPSFDFPLPDGSGGTFVYTVDLSPFDPVAEVFRVLMTVTFCLGLIYVTRNFIFKGGSSE